MTDTEMVRAEIREVIREELRKFEARKFKFSMWEDNQGVKYEVEAYDPEYKEVWADLVTFVQKKVAERRHERICEQLEGK